jgi:hypothetical protein
MEISKFSLIRLGVFEAVRRAVLPGIGCDRRNQTLLIHTAADPLTTQRSRCFASGKRPPGLHDSGATEFAFVAVGGVGNPPAPRIRTVSILRNRLPGKTQKITASYVQLELALARISQPAQQYFLRTSVPR